LKIEIIKFHPRGIIKTDSRMFFQNYIWNHDAYTIT
jgi:hypothetical protein